MGQQQALSPEMIKEISRAAVQAAMEFQEKEKQKQQTNRDRRLRNIKLLLKNYRNFKKHCDTRGIELDNMDDTWMLKELGAEELALDSIKRSKVRTKLMVKFIDRMIAVYRIMCEQSGREEDKRIYQSIKLLYLDEERSTAKEIAICHKTDTRTVYRDVDKACEALASLIFGVDSIRFVE
ncbi:hypothetical protein [Brevibacillus choshinensis]|uniref:Uncharacterized protein n=1 Tax=Brevibacillus choshinensis TaxID=54911 RepID=A0ABX7FLI0_BRECH|nr:hypothetical protein [Brevibacillus choshinensis]QRG66941.1 hypothetical protein JNE38_26265 [Brevibacillus choshinensis]